MSDLPGLMTNQQLADELASLRAQLAEAQAERDANRRLLNTALKDANALKARAEAAEAECEAWREWYYRGKERGWTRRWMGRGLPTTALDWINAGGIVLATWPLRPFAATAGLGTAIVGTPPRTVGSRPSVPLRGLFGATSFHRGVWVPSDWSGEKLTDFAHAEAAR